MTTNVFLNEFWYKLSIQHKKHVIINCYEEYNRFLKGEATEKDYEIIKRYIKNIVDNINKKFMDSAENGYLNIVKAYLNLGANIHVNDDYVLRHSSYIGHLNVVKYLVKHGANVHAKSGQALTWAAKYGKLDVVKCLVKHKADIVNSKAIEAAKEGNHSNIVAYLESNLHQ